MKLLLEVITPTKVVLKEEVDEVTIPSVEGEITILPNHVGLLTKLMPGKMVIKRSGKEEDYVVFGGFLEVSQNHLTVLADHAARATDMEIAKAIEARERARFAMQNRQSEKEFRMAEANIKRTLLEKQISRTRRSYKP